LKFGPYGLIWRCIFLVPVLYFLVYLVTEYLRLYGIDGRSMSMNTENLWNGNEHRKTESLGKTPACPIATLPTINSTFVATVSHFLAPSLAVEGAL
jgi:hypothetical protein